MKESTRKLIQWVGLGIGILCGILALLFAMANGSDVKTLDAVQGNAYFDITYWLLIIMVAVSVCAIFFYAVKKVAARFSSEKGYAKRFLIVVGLIVMVCLVSFLLAKGNDVTPALLEKNELSLGASKLIGAACIMVYLLVIGAAGTIIWSEISKSLKKK